VHNPVPRPSTIAADVPAWLDVVVERALAKDSRERWPSIADFGFALGGTPRHSTTTTIRNTAAPGGLLGTYELGERVGTGRLGSDVHRGTHCALAHPVAIRILRKNSQRNWDGARARFMREAQALQVAHPSIIQVRDYGEEPGLVYLVTDFIEGPSLRELLNAAGPLPWTRLAPLLAQLGEATRMLHRRKGLLCGVTPELMRVASDDEGERLMISSAGIWQAQDLLSTLHDQTLRGIGLADAELRYVAPELLTGRDADVRSDVFTMGVLGYEMATGRLPYDGASMPILLGNMLRGATDDPCVDQPTLPVDAGAALVKALRPTPEDRFPTALEFGRALLGVRS
jgi:serine/threonine-protein kinase